MRPRSLAAAAVLVGFALTAALASPAAGDQAEEARRAAAVAHIGPQVITAGELEDRLAAVPRFQLQTFGDSADAIRRNFLQQVLVPEVLYAEAAEAENLDQHLQTKGQIDRMLADATLRATRARLGLAVSIPMEDVQKYYDANRARYDTPERYAVWRILCHSREEAIAVLEAAKKDVSIPNFNALARDHSLDKATNQRGGNLGVVGLDGASSEAGLHVDPAIVKAAAGVKDGELVPQPVPEGSGFAVIWHRGTIPAVHRSASEAAAQIRDTLWREREEVAVKKEVADLRATQVKELNESMLDGIDVAPNSGAVVPRRRPGQVPPLSRSSRVAPE